MAFLTTRSKSEWLSLTTGMTASGAWSADEEPEAELDPVAEPHCASDPGPACRDTWQPASTRVRDTAHGISATRRMTLSFKGFLRGWKNVSPQLRCSARTASQATALSSYRARKLPRTPGCGRPPNSQGLSPVRETATGTPCSRLTRRDRCPDCSVARPPRRQPRWPGHARREPACRRAPRVPAAGSGAGSAPRTRDAPSGSGASR